MPVGTTEKPKPLIGASIPRSGHHFLQTMLSAYFGPEMYYCEWYTPPNCCRQIPCTRRGRQTINFQKSHDRDHDVPSDVPDAQYIIQYRHPVPEALSDRELDLNDAFGRRSIVHRRSREYFMQWLSEKAIYYRKFHDRWMAKRLPNALYLDYEELSNDPAGVMRKIIKIAYGSVDEPRLVQHVEQITGTRVSAPFMNLEATAFKPRVVQDSKYFDEDLLGAMEDYILTRCPHYGFQRLLKGSYQNHPLYGLIVMRDSDEPLPAGEKNRLNAAAKLNPDHPEILGRIAQRTLRKGDVQDAIKLLHELLERYPYYSAGYKMLFAAYRENGESIPWQKLSGNALLGCAENIELLIDLGGIYLEQGRNVAAISALATALTMNADHKRANQLFAKALITQRRWAQAEPYAVKAVEGEHDKEADEVLDKIRRRVV